MKKLFTYLLFTVLALITTECRVSNLEPTPQVIENNDGSKMTIFGTPKYSNNVKIIDSTSYNLVRIEGNRLYIKEGVKIKSPANGRVSVDVSLTVGDITILELPQAIRTKIEQGIDKVNDIMVKLKSLIPFAPNQSSGVTVYEFEYIGDLSKVFKDFKAVFEVRYETTKTPVNIIPRSVSRKVPTKKDESKKIQYERDIECTSCELNVTLNYHHSVIFVLNIKDNKLIEASTTAQIYGQIKLKANLAGKYTIDVSSQPFWESNNTIRRFVGFVPIIIGEKANVIFGGKLEIEGTVSTNEEFISQSFSGVMTSGYSNGVVKKPVFTLDEQSPNLNKLSTGAKVTGKFGPKITIEGYIYNENFMSLKGTADFNLGITAKILNCNFPSSPSKYQTTVTLNFEPAIEFGFKFIEELIGGDFVLEFSETYTMKILNIVNGRIEDRLPENELMDISCGYTFEKDIKPIGDDAIDIETNDFYPLRDLLKADGLLYLDDDINEMPILQGIYECKPDLVKHSSINAEGFFEKLLVNKKLYTKIKIIFDNSNSKRKYTIEVRHFDANTSKIIAVEVSDGVTFRGKGNNFTIFAKMKGKDNSENSEYENSFIMSGTKTSEGIRNFNHGFKRLKNIKTSTSSVAVGKYRIYNTSQPAPSVSSFD